MRRVPHRLAMECSAAARPGDEPTDASFRSAGGQDYRGETEQRHEGDWPAQPVRGTDEQVNEQEELDAAREWLRHVEAGRIGEHP